MFDLTGKLRLSLELAVALGKPWRAPSRARCYCGIAWNAGGKT